MRRNVAFNGGEVAGRVNVLCNDARMVMMTAPLVSAGLGLCPVAGSSDDSITCGPAGY